MSEFVKKRMDQSLEKRVELHAHTRPENGNILTAQELMETVSGWNHSAVAVTDYTGIQGIEQLKVYWEKYDSIKLILGMEAYFSNQATCHLGTILVKNQTGRKSINQLITQSFSDKSSDIPCISKNVMERYRKDFLLGSGLRDGELFQAILAEKPEKELERIVLFYDYLEIQPPCDCYMNDQIYSEDVIRKCNQKIVALGDQYNKLVVATSDVKFLNPEEYKIRDSVLEYYGITCYDKENRNAFLRTTEEMLNEFSDLGEEKAREIVITNTNLIADQIEKYSLFPLNKCDYITEETQYKLRELCLQKAKELYGNDLPSPVSDRLEKELERIFAEGHTWNIWSIHELLKDYLEEDMPIQARGVTAASFVCFLLGLTDVNPLNAHYRCSKCLFTDFTSFYVTPYQILKKTCKELPDQICPKCGTKMDKDGFNLRYQFIWDGLKRKFSYSEFNTTNEFQKKIKSENFGEKTTLQVYRASCYTRIEYENLIKAVQHYARRNHILEGSEECRYYRDKLFFLSTKVKEHPFKLYYLPDGEDVLDFSPVEVAKNPYELDKLLLVYDLTGEGLPSISIINNPKLDLLSKLEIATGVSRKSISYNDQKVLDYLNSLPVTQEEVDGCFSFTESHIHKDFLLHPQERMIIQKTGIQSFADLISVLGLSHGTGSWYDNAEILFKTGQITELSSFICHREDIAEDLIRWGITENLAWEISNNISYGKNHSGKCSQWPEWKKLLINEGVPDWYIWSMEQIKYLFTRAHSVTFAKTIWQLAWYKVYETKAYNDVRGQDPPQRYNISIAEIDDMIQSVDETFQEKLFHFIDKKQKDYVEIYKKARIDRKLFSKIRNNPNYRPSKNLVLQLAIALELNLRETEQLLNATEYALSRSNIRDIIITYFIQNAIYDLDAIDDMLYEYQQTILTEVKSRRSKHCD